MQFTNRLAQFVNSTTMSDFSEEIVGIAKEHILDCLGVTIAGSCEPSGKIITDFVKNMAAELGSTVICGGFKSHPTQAALANGTMAHALDFDDDYSDYTILHPTAVVLSATLACAEASKASGKAVLEAYILGVETAIAIGIIGDMEDIKRGWHGTSTLGTLGATMAVSKILGLSVDQMQIALGIAVSSSSGLRENFGTMTKPLHAGNAAMNGVRAAMLAAKGFTASKDSLEGSFGFFNLFSTPGKWEKKLNTVDSLGNPFKIVTPGIYIKQYPSCAGTHSSIDAVLHLVNEYDVRPEQVDSLECLVHPLNVGFLTYKDPQTSLEAKFSMQFCLAIAILERKVGIQQFTEEKVLHPDTQELMQKINVSAEPSMQGKDYMQGCAIEIKLKDRRMLRFIVEIPAGSPRNRLSRDQLRGKYRSCCGLALSEKKVEESLSFLENLENVQDISVLFQMLSSV